MDLGEVAEALGDVAEGFARVGVDHLGEEAEVLAGDGEELVEGRSGFEGVAEEGEGLTFARPPRVVNGVS